MKQKFKQYQVKVYSPMVVLDAQEFLSAVLWQQNRKDFRIIQCGDT